MTKVHTRMDGKYKHLSKSLSAKHCVAQCPRSHQNVPKTLELTPAWRHQVVVVVAVASPVMSRIAIVSWLARETSHKLSA